MNVKLSYYIGYFSHKKWFSFLSQVDTAYASESLTNHKTQKL